MTSTALPSGSLTFLFTDIEGSTQLWERHPDAMSVALQQHDTLLRAALEAHHGYVFKTVGDAFCATFAHAPDALCAALTLQRTLNSAEWPAEIGLLHVRVGLHTGTAEERDHDYFGPAVNRVARLQATAHGGQVVLSHATAEAVRAALPTAITLRHLGQFRLKDLFQPEQIYQVCAPDLRTDFPPLHTADARQHNLPTEATPFIGREREVAAVLNLVRRPDVRLVTLTGPGGTGKTRLSLQVAAALLDEFPDGVWFVELAAVSTPDRLLPALAATLKVKEQESAAEPLAQVLAKHLAGKRTLLILDNLEQIVEAAPQLGDLLTATTHLKLITSSRIVLRIYGEHDYPVPPLALPEAAQRHTVAVLAQYEAVRLFIARARAAQPSFTLTAENAPAIVEICTRLDGLPLALELAAARARLLTPQAMLKQLNNRLTLLTGGARNLPARQQTLRGAVDWSYTLLTPAEQTLFARLGVFAGGWTLDAALAVCAAGLDLDIFTGLESLLDKSMLRTTVGPDDETRFVMLETIREYAAEKLRHGADYAAVADAHAAYYCAFAQRNDVRALRSSNRVGQLFAQIRAEQDNFRAAQAWLAAQGDYEALLHAFIGQWYFWNLNGQRTEGLDWLETTLARAPQASPKLHADALRAAANLASSGGFYDKNKAYLQECLQIYETLGDLEGIGSCLNNLGIYAEHISHDFAQARRYYEQSIAIMRTLNNPALLLSAMYNLGTLYIALKNFEEATTLTTEALAIARRLGSLERLGNALAYAGEVAYHNHNDAQAHTYWAECLNIAYTAQVFPPIINLIHWYGWLAARRGKYPLATQLLAQADFLNREHIINFHSDLEETNAHLAAARAHLGQAAFDAAWAEGATLTLDDAVALTHTVLDA